MRQGISSVVMAMAVAGPLVISGCAASNTNKTPASASKPTQRDAILHVNGLN